MKQFLCDRFGGAKVTRKGTQLFIKSADNEILHELSSSEADELYAGFLIESAGGPTQQNPLEKPEPAQPSTHETIGRTHMKRLIQTYLCPYPVVKLDMGTIQNLSAMLYSLQTLGKLNPSQLKLVEFRARYNQRKLLEAQARDDTREAQDSPQGQQNSPQEPQDD